MSAQETYEKYFTIQFVPRGRQLMAVLVDPDDSNQGMVLGGMVSTVLLTRPELMAQFNALMVATLAAVLADSGDAPVEPMEVVITSGDSPTMN